MQKRTRSALLRPMGINYDFWHSNKDQQKRVQKGSLKMNTVKKTNIFGRITPEIRILHSAGAKILIYSKIHIEILIFHEIHTFILTKLTFLESLF